MMTERADSVIQPVSHSLLEAKALYKTGCSAEAIALLKHLLKQTPDDIATREFLGDIYKAQKVYIKARQQYQYIFDHHYDAVDVALKLFYIYLSQPRQSRLAYHTLRRTARCNPNHLTVWLWYTIFCQMWMCNDEEIEVLQAKVEALSAGDIEKELEVATAYLASGLLDEAQAACARGLNLNDRDSRIYHLLFQIYLEEGFIWLADAALRQAQALAQLDARLYYGQLMSAVKANALAIVCDDQQRIPAYFHNLTPQLTAWQQLAILQLKMKAYADAFFICIVGDFNKKSRG